MKLLPCILESPIERAANMLNPKPRTIARKPATGAIAKIVGSRNPSCPTKCRKMKHGYSKRMVSVANEASASVRNHPNRRVKQPNRMIPIGNTKAETIFKKSDTLKNKLPKSLKTKRRATTLYKNTRV